MPRIHAPKKGKLKEAAAGLLVERERESGVPQGRIPSPSPYTTTENNLAKESRIFIAEMPPLPLYCIEFESREFNF